MPVQDCVANPNFSLTGAVTLTNTGQDGAFLSAMSGTTTLAGLTGQLEVLSTSPTPANTLVRLLLVSGPGPTYTDEVILCEQAGTSTGDKIITGTWDLTRNLPVAGRPWSATTDQARLRWSGAWGQPAGQTVHLEFRICNTAAALADCCAQLLAALDSLTKAVSKVYANVP